MMAWHEIVNQLEEHTCMDQLLASSLERVKWTMAWHEIGNQPVRRAYVYG